MLLLGVSEVVIHNKTGAQGDRVQLCPTSVTTFLKLKKKGPLLIPVGSASCMAFRFPPKLRIRSPTPELPLGGWGVR